MGVIETRVFKSDEGAAVPLPAELGFEEGAPVTIEKIGNTLYICPVRTMDADEEKRRLREFLDELDAIWKDAPDHPDRGKRHPIEFPDRPDLY